ncbi:MBL fold metallo-hydrolase [Flavobacterium sp. Root186]|uniref:MBL fold metallo-hydrolase n=1 Tax=Flavobacterium sp. Root186 TaxID=1736485 RepID=UPI0006F7B7E3|nr:MBL fold metallo-hydrolase [Flavobacterium sp. Root186]KRB53739.1 hypothetical protein ASD98_22400 [Flavobacterium sp. Root186]
MLTIHLLPALYGDTILIDIAKNENQPNTNILVDCGFNFTSGLLPLLEDHHTKGKIIDRFIITHYDEDHISSAAKLIKDNGSASSAKIIKIDQVWHNAYRHLQFEKQNLKPLSPLEEGPLKNFIASQNPQDTSRGTQIGAKQASKLGKELLSGDYSWNTDFQGQAVCIEHKTEVLIKEGVKIILLGPNKTQLQALESAFKRGLKEFGVTLSASEFIDDAFELYIKSIEKGEVENYQGEITGSLISSFTPEIIESIVKNAKYKADRTVGNGSSISFILEADHKKILFLADAHAEPIIEQLQLLYPGQDKLFFDAVKVGHHGSLANNPRKLYDYIDSPLYLISTNGEHPSHAHPDIETLAFIINRPLPENLTSRKLFFNYAPKNLAGIFDDNLKEKLNYTTEVSNKIDL